MPSPDEEAEIEASRAPLLEHLAELRNRLIICVVALFLAFGVLFYFSENILETLLRPYKVAAGLVALQTDKGDHGAFNLDLIRGLFGMIDLPAPKKDLAVVQTAPLEIFWMKVKVAAMGAVGVMFPLLAFQLYRFVAPGLYRRERGAFVPFLFASPLLFLLGTALVFYIMFPFVLWFSLNQEVASLGGVSISSMYKISDYIALAAGLLLAFGLCFQLPVVLSLLGLAGFVSSKSLRTFRRYAIVAVFIVAAVVTPPDPISQLTLAIPMIMLYEVSIWCVWLLERRRKRRDAAEVATV